MTRKAYVFLTLYLSTFINVTANLENDFRYISYQDLQLSFDTFSQTGVTYYSQLLFDVARNQVLVGARDMLFRLSLPHLTLLENASWISPEYKTSLCLAKGQSDENCHNYVKVLLTNGKKVFTCGTESFSPSCTWREIENISKVIQKVDGVAKCPYNPLSNITALLSESGDYYVGGPTDFSGSDFAIYRSIGQHSIIRTKQYNSMWLNEPQFVGSFENDQFIYFLFREAAVEYINCGKIVYSRIARMCKNDRGGQVMLKDNWTTFIKARLNCSISGDYPFYFDEIQSTAYIPDENILYATFSTPSNAIAGSAICAFNLTAINNAFAGPFKYQEHTGSTWNKHYAQNQDHSECKSSAHNKNLLESSKFQLMDDAVQSTTLSPLYSTEFERFTHLTIDVISTKLHASVHVIFVATLSGLVKKLTVLPRTQETCVVEIWNPVPDVSIPILSMQYLKDTNSVYVGTKYELLKIPSHHCDRHVSKNSCLNAMDPYCGWNELEDACTIAPNSDPLVKYWRQSVTTCPVLDAPVDGGWSSWQDWAPCNHRISSEPDSNDECLCKYRACNNPAPQNGGYFCRGNSITVTNCTVHGGWTSWPAWSECSATCGVAVKTRTRTCSNPAPAHKGRVCVGQDRSEVLCTGNPPCPVATPTPQDGGWSGWSDWTQCTVSCGRGFRTRKRLCNNPQPLLGGIECIGSNIEYDLCNQHQCPERVKQTPWSAWYNISYDVTNNEVVQRRYKHMCRVNATQLKISIYKNETRTCRDRQCSEDAATQWSPWGEYSDCNATCGGGMQSRSRVCEGRAECSGQSVQTKSCNLQACISEWNCWTDWSPCSVTCGWGIRKRFRSCLGTQCKGEHMQEEHCEAPICGSLLGWEDWTVWSECDKNQEQHRKRNCRTTNAGPQMCQGPDKEKRMCLDPDDISNDIPGALNITTSSASASMIVGAVLVTLVAFFAGALLMFVYNKKRKPRLPSSPHYMSAKSNPYIAVPFQDRPKRQSATTSNAVLNNSHNNGTIRSLKCYDYDTIKRNSHGLNNGHTKTELLDDKYYE